eukprot:TRINITY_DN27266_c0_g1_i1.p1 TRINITY_DN27266_c0_g1~~TRINITY_DN27266_c0_g1_i1.p1  ORF type:complete len:238 (+),score=45.50 TRINITY_DN27266_c0_g1_i1:82-795(+)
MMFPDPVRCPRLPVQRTVVRDHRFVDVELQPQAAVPLQLCPLFQGDVVSLTASPVEPDGARFVVDGVSRGGLAVSLRLEGPLGEEGRICAKGLLTGSKFTILANARVGEFTVHRHVSVDGTDRLKLHFAHGSQLVKLQLQRGSAIKIKERPCGFEDWMVVEAHTENLDRCPNCRTGLSGPRSREFDAADLCAPGTQWALVEPRPAKPPAEGIAMFGERSTKPLPELLQLLARPDPRR